MAFRSRSRRWLAAWLVLAIALVQVAVAAHACGLAGAVADAPALSIDDPCAHDMGAAGVGGDLGLCQQHCQFGNTQQPADRATSADPPAASFAVLYALPPIAVIALPGAPPTLWRGPRETPAAAPALSRLHGRYRL